MTARLFAVLLAAAMVAAGAMLFGSALAAEGDTHTEPAARMEEAGVAEEKADVEPGGAEVAGREEGEEGGNAALKVVSAFLIAAGAAALVPLTVFTMRRRDEEAMMERSAAGRLVAIAALLSAAAAAIHFAVISEHLEVWWAEGAFFIVAAVVQLLWAIAVVVRPQPFLYLVGIAGNAFLAVTWVLTRTAGVPLGPDAREREPVGLIDVMATSYEVVAVVLLALAIRSRPVSVAPLLTPASWIVTLLLVPLTAVALLDLVEL